MTDNDIAREHFKELGLKYWNITKDDIDELHAMLTLMMAETRATLTDEPVQSHWKMCRKYKFIPIDGDNDGMFAAFLRCDGSYFEKREVISFNSDGFIGFCGWASSKNTKPITDTFMAWCDRIAARKA